MSLHTWGRQRADVPTFTFNSCQGSCAIFTFNSHWGKSRHRQIVLLLCVQGRFGSVQLFATLQTNACQISLSERGSSRQEYWRYWPILVAIPFQSTIFSAALATNSPEYLVWPEPLQPKQLHHLHTWPSQEQTPVDGPHAEVEIKPQLKPRGSVAKEGHPKPSHQLYKLQIKSTQSTKQTLCLWNI